ncbi:MAG: L-threonylcarbamoyladenylate synthase, partial [Clostridiales bacterium]|nr:L-threonylcarbamoyladenylate synthase [Clostridiales bacterium]
LPMIFNKREVVPYDTPGGLDTVAVRMPSHPVAQALIRGSGGYIAAPSANTSGRPSPTTAEHVASDLDGKIPMILDGGAVNIGIESTIVDLTGEVPQILRPGYITRTMVEKVIGRAENDPGLASDDPNIRPKAPGMKYRHYAPEADLVLVNGPTDKVVETINSLAAGNREKGIVTGVISTEETYLRYNADIVRSIGSRKDELSISQRLYALLREFDELGARQIYSECFSELDIGPAVMNRLEKAAGHRMIYI